MYLLNIINSITKDKILSLEEKFMLITLKTLDTKDENVVSASYEQLMKALSTQRRAKVSVILKSLKDKKYIEAIRRGRRENEYIFIKDYLISSNEQDDMDYELSSKNETIEKDESFNNEIFDEFSSDKNETTNSDNSSILNSTKTVYDMRTGVIITDKINNHINKNINNSKDVYEEIAAEWNMQNINEPVILNVKVTESIYKAVNKYGVDKVKKGIRNYSRVYYSEYYYNFEWEFTSFLSRPNGISRFLDDGDIWLKYRKQYKSLKDDYEEYGINYEDYINNI